MGYKILFCGVGYGAGNIGDDAILAGFLTSCRMHLQKDTQYGVITFGPSFPHDRTEVDQVFSLQGGADIAFTWATHIVLGGATLLTEGSIPYCSELIKLAQTKKKPVCMLGVGTSTKPMGDFLWLLQKHYGSLDMITLRSEADKKAAVSMGLKAENLYVCADGAFAIDYKDVTYGSDNVLGVNLVHEELPNKHPYVQTVKALLTGLASDFKFSFLCEETRKDMQYDFFLLHELHKQFQGSFSCGYVDYKAFLNKMAGCRLILTMRMHMMIFCALLDIPCLPIIREKKMQLMADELGLTQVLSLDETLYDARSVVLKVLKNLSLAKVNRNKIGILRQRSFNNGNMLQKWVTKTLKV